MVQIYQHNTQQVTTTEVRLDAIWGALDDLHTAIMESSGQVTQKDMEMLEWLHEMGYMVQEAIEELEGRMAQAKPQPTIHLVEKPSGAKSSTPNLTISSPRVLRRDEIGS